MDSSSYRESHLAKGSDYDRDLDQGNFDSYMLIHEAKILGELIPKLFLGKASNYLDFACGTGRITTVVENLVDKSFGIDVSKSMVMEAKEKCTKTEFHITDITSTSPPEKGFNLITAFRFFGNAEQDLRKAVLLQLSNMTETGGYLVVNNHRNPWSLHELFLRLKGNSNSLDLSYKNLSSMLENHGFKIERKIGIGIWVCSYGLRRNTVKSGSILRFLEPLSQFSLLAPFCPDYIVVARKL